MQRLQHCPNRRNVLVGYRAASNDAADQLVLALVNLRELVLDGIGIGLAGIFKCVDVRLNCDIRDGDSLMLNVGLSVVGRDVVLPSFGRRVAEAAQVHCGT